MPRLVDADAPASREMELRHDPPTLLRRLATACAATLELLDSGPKVITHEVEFVRVVLVSRVKSHLTRRQGKPVAWPSAYWQAGSLYRWIFTSFQTTAAVGNSFQGTPAVCQAAPQAIIA